MQKCCQFESWHSNAPKYAKSAYACFSPCGHSSATHFPELYTFSRIIEFAAQQKGSEVSTGSEKGDGFQEVLNPLWVPVHLLSPASCPCHDVARKSGWTNGSEWWALLYRMFFRGAEPNSQDWIFVVICFRQLWPIIGCNWIWMGLYNLLMGLSVLIIGKGPKL